MYNNKKVFPFIKQEFNENWKLLTKEIVQNLFKKYKLEIQIDLTNDKEDLEKRNHTTANKYMDLVYKVKIAEKKIKEGFAAYLKMLWNV
ncbi:hypothetical protein [Mycoplasmopsis fermentans]|uniref:Uncharacterized protein n=2 Tax=Mycoplasmopsis fermentans TaxID=2115 RepID=C4XE98_MYCFP|nr:hypothetical protein [Mycoplasmopsis fermentans]VEU67664.1 Uncharacterised protein [Mesomycoplasma conjunctivae]ADN68755.1 hypothetical protein MFE_01370 [Mycoplasmopsis fermentans JER]ADV34167.1 Conserved Hypothetical Protein [Mycoplasmopsis fermentans M64]RMX36154.1 hypothetical protein MFI2_0134 [Mycoplasmopsis fermentans MF-I2]RMX36197.1 hypothetical protein MFI1_0122 [Mycoplasmopsis fermentans MF-I1]